MKPNLHLKTSQKLSLTPQLQRAIKLLQLSSQELSQDIQRRLESNPFLEMDETEHSEIDNSAGSHETPEPDVVQDTSWEDVYTTSHFSSNPASNLDIDLTPKKEASLQEHLEWQLNLTPCTDQDKAIALLLIDAISDEGYLTVSLEDIKNVLKNPTIDIADIEAVLRRIQQFDPLGVGARSLQECLLVQLNALPEQPPHLTLAKLIAKKYLDLLGKIQQQGIKELKSQLKFERELTTNQLTEDNLREAIHLLTSLYPKPGSIYQIPQESSHVLPDVIVMKKNNKFVVELNMEAMPKIRLHPQIEALSRKVVSERDQSFVKEKLNEARWLLKSLKTRNDTLLKVATAIMEEQRDFLEQGHTAMKPLILEDIAKRIDMHESTVSRITTQKYILTPQGMYELKYFFSPGLRSTQHADASCSATVIKALIKQFVQEEDKNKPLSDEDLRGRLFSKQGVYVARRTIAKYREELGLKSSSNRKVLRNV